MDKILQYGKGEFFTFSKDFKEGDYFQYYGTNRVDTFWLDSKKFGVQNTEEWKSVSFPKGGVIQIYEMQTIDNKTLGYIKLGFGNDIIECGEKRNDVYLTITDGLNVQLTGLSDDEKGIHGMQFRVVTS